MLDGRSLDPVSIRLPRGGTATFPLAIRELSEAAARAGVIKDAAAAARGAGRSGRDRRGGARVARGIAPAPRNREGAVNTRKSPLLALATLAALAAGGADAQINPFSAYYENVARAARQNDAAALRSLIANDGNPNQTDPEGRTALHYAALNGNLTIIAILVKANAKLDVKDTLGNTALHLAADRNQPEAARLLLDVGAPVDPENRNGMTPLMMAANRGNIEIVQALLAKGASVTKTDFTGRDAAGWAAESHRPNVVQTIKRAQTAKRS
jgi:hypothetical protein